jgi:cytochrome c-type biogenesis protein CcmF
VTVTAAFFLGEFRIHYYALLFASVFGAAANTDYFIRVLNGKFSNAGGSIAHTGMALLLLGALISNSKKEIISRNVKNIDLGKEIPNRENIMIEQKTDTLPMGPYYVSYTGNEKRGVNIYYNISYFKLDETGRKQKVFDLQPLVQLNERMGNVAEPATKHYLTKDVYTHITYAQLEQPSDTANGFLEPKVHDVAIGDTFVTSNSFVILQELNRKIDRSELALKDSDLVVGARLLAEDINRKLYSAEPLFMIKDFSILTRDDEIPELGLKFTFGKIDPETGKIQISVAEKISNRKEFIIMKAIIFPGINILWTGCILMFLGTLIAVRKRIRKFRANHTS